MIYRYKKFLLFTSNLILISTTTCKSATEISKNRSAYKGIVDPKSFRVARPAFTRTMVLEFSTFQPVECDIKFAPLEEEKKARDNVKCEGKPFGDKYLYNYTINDSDLLKRYHFRVEVWKKGFSKPRFPENYEYSESEIDSWINSSFTLKTKINFNYYITQSTILSKNENKFPDGCDESFANHKLERSYTENIAPISFKGFFTGSSSLSNSFRSHAGSGHIDNIQDNTEIITSFMEKPINHKVSSLNILKLPTIKSGNIIKELIEIENSTKSNAVSIKQVDGISVSLDIDIFNSIDRATLQIGSPGKSGYKICNLSKMNPKINIKASELSKSKDNELTQVALTMHKIEVKNIDVKPIENWEVEQSKTFITNIKVL